MHRLASGLGALLLGALTIAPAGRAELGLAPPVDPPGPAAAPTLEPETPFAAALRERLSALLRETKS